MQWTVTTGRMGIHVAVMTMGRFRMQPRVGPLKRVEIFFGFLRNFKGCSIKFRRDQPSYGRFKKTVNPDWNYIYGDANEELLEKTLEPKGKVFTISSLYDANLYHDRTTGRVATGIITMLNKTPIDWINKRQATGETATYGSEMVATRITVDQLVEWRYILRMLGEPFSENGGHFKVLVIERQL